MSLPELEMHRPGLQKMGIDPTKRRLVPVKSSQNLENRPELWPKQRQKRLQSMKTLVLISLYTQRQRMILLILAVV